MFSLLPPLLRDLRAKQIIFFFLVHETSLFPSTLVLPCEHSDPSRLLRLRVLGPKGPEEQVRASPPAPLPPRPPPRGLLVPRPEGAHEKVVAEGAEVQVPKNYSSATTT